LRRPPPAKAAEQASIASRVVFSQRIETEHHVELQEGSEWLPMLALGSIFLCICGACSVFFGKRFRFKILQHGKGRTTIEEYDEQQPLVSDMGGMTARTEFSSHGDHAPLNSVHTDAFQIASGHTEQITSATAHLPTPRYVVGTRVRCHVSGEWREGRILRHWWRDESWPSGEFVPYVIQLENGQHCCAPADDESCIRLWEEHSNFSYQSHSGGGSTAFASGSRIEYGNAGGTSPRSPRGGRAGNAAGYHTVGSASPRGGGGGGGGSTFFRDEYHQSSGGPGGGGGGTGGGAGNRGGSSSPKGQVPGERDSGSCAPRCFGGGR